MEKKLSRLFLFIFLLTIYQLEAQTILSQKTPENSLQQNDDTIYNFTLREFVVVDSDSAYRANYNRYLSYILVAYPYAQMAKKMLVIYNEDLDSINSKRDSKKYVNHAYEDLKEKFSNGIKTLTVNQGKVLVKLIYRETGMTAYDITKNYMGSFKAVMWQSISRLGGADLKLTYDPHTGDDRIIERIVKKIEKKEIYVPEEPFIPENARKYIKARNRAFRQYNQAKKQAEKDKHKSISVAHN